MGNETEAKEPRLLGCDLRPRQPGSGGRKMTSVRKDSNEVPQIRCGVSQKWEVKEKQRLFRPKKSYYTECFRREIVLSHPI